MCAGMVRICKVLRLEKGGLHRDSTTTGARERPGLPSVPGSFAGLEVCFDSEYFGTVLSTVGTGRLRPNRNLTLGGNQGLFDK